MGGVCSKAMIVDPNKLTEEELKEVIEIDGKIRTLYPLVGEKAGCEDMAQRFYEKVWADVEHPGFQLSTAFGSEPIEVAVGKLSMFLVESFGGPDDYSKKRNSLLKFNRSIHLLWRTLFTPEHIARWLHHMHEVIDETDTTPEIRQLLRDYFRVGIDRIMESQEKFDSHNDSPCPHGKQWVI